MNGIGNIEWIEAEEIRKEMEMRVEAVKSFGALANNRIFEDYFAASASKGVYIAAYDYLYRWVRGRKPEEVLECGTGKSTIAIALAMLENGFGRVTSMEEDMHWYDHAVARLPEELEEYVEIILSPVTRYKIGLENFGFRYKDVPVRPYEMVFIDGPQKQPNLDYLWVLKNCNRDAAGLLDKRAITRAGISKVGWTQSKDAPGQSGLVIFRSTLRDKEEDEAENA